MSRALIVIRTEAERRKAESWCRTAPFGTRVEYKETKRSVPQNALLWATLSEIASKAEHNGKKYPADIWKHLFLHALGREMQFIPALDGKTFLPIGQSSSDLSRQEMAALLDFIDAWAAQNGIELSERASAGQGIR